MAKPRKKKAKPKLRPRRRRMRKLTTTVLAFSLAFLIGCKTKPVKPTKPPRPGIPAKKEPLPKLADFHSFLKFFQQKLKTKSPRELAAEYPLEQRKNIFEALTFLAKAKRPTTSEARLKELNAVKAKVNRFVNEQTRLDRATMGLLAEQWVRDHALKSTAELLEERLQLMAKPKIDAEFEYDARAVTLEILFQILQHRLKQAK